jgi:hypothetical protein
MTEHPAYMPRIVGKWAEINGAENPEADLNSS